MTNHEFDEWLVKTISIWADDETYHTTHDQDPWQMMQPLTLWLVDMAGYHHSVKYSATPLGERANKFWHDATAYARTIEWLRKQMMAKSK